MELSVFVSEHRPAPRKRVLECRGSDVEPVCRGAFLFGMASGAEMVRSRDRKYGSVDGYFVGIVVEAGEPDLVALGPDIVGMRDSYGWFADDLLGLDLELISDVYRPDLLRAVHLSLPHFYRASKPCGEPGTGLVAVHRGGGTQLCLSGDFMGIF